MRTPEVTVITGTQDTPALESLLGAVFEAWPSFCEKPPVNRATFERVQGDPESLFGVALIVVDDAYDASLHKLIDVMEPRMVPMLVLLSEQSDRAIAVLGSSVVSVPMGTEPVVIAAMLHTMLAQLPHLMELQAEMRVNQRFQGGLRQEMSLMHEEMQLAGRIQREFLPDEMPAISGVSFDVFFRPVGYVSGDIYDVKRVDEHRVGFVLADAVGHGVPAALMTMIMARALPSMEQGLADGASVEPSAALHRLNEVMIRGGGDKGRFATAVYGVIDARTHEVTLAGAGHPPPLVIGPGGARAIETEGPLLGIFPDAEFPQVKFQIEPGEFLMLYSDGFETAFPNTAAKEHERKLPTELYLEHFGSLAGAMASGDLHSATKQLEDALDAQAGSLHQIDDLTALFVAPSVAAASGDVAGQRAAA